MEQSTDRDDAGSLPLSTVDIHRPASGRLLTPPLANVAIQRGSSVVSASRGNRRTSVPTATFASSLASAAPRPVWSVAEAEVAAVLPPDVEPVRLGVHRLVTVGRPGQAHHDLTGGDVLLPRPAGP
jgi:hypothetical protein